LRLLAQLDHQPHLRVLRIPRRTGISAHHFFRPPPNSPSACHGARLARRKCTTSFATPLLLFEFFFPPESTRIFTHHSTTGCARVITLIPYIPAARARQTDISRRRTTSPPPSRLRKRPIAARTHSPLGGRSCLHLPRCSLHHTRTTRPSRPIITRPTRPILSRQVPPPGCTWPDVPMDPCPRHHPAAKADINTRSPRP